MKKTNTAMIGLGLALNIFTTAALGDSPSDMPKQPSQPLRLFSNLMLLDVCTKDAHKVKMALESTTLYNAERTEIADEIKKEIIKGVDSAFLDLYSSFKASVSTVSAEKLEATIQAAKSFDFKVIKAARNNFELSINQLQNSDIAILKNFEVLSMVIEPNISRDCDTGVYI